MTYAQLIRSLSTSEGDDSGPDSGDFQGLFAAMLDGGMPELELGALLVALSTRPPTPPMLLGFSAALAARVLTIHWPAPVPGAVPRPVVIPAYGGARRQRNLAPLVALVLQRLRVPVLLHGTLDGHGGVASAYILRELGVLPCATPAQAQATLARERLAFVPTGVIAPGLAHLLSLRSRLGVSGVCPTMALLPDPFAGAGVRMVAADDLETLAALRAVLLAEGGTALLMQGTEGEAFVNPRRRPRIELLRDGTSATLFRQEPAHEESADGDNGDVAPRATAAWISRALAGAAALPPPIVNQLACCLFAAGQAADLNEAKAIVAVESRSLAAA